MKNKCSICKVASDCKLKDSVEKCDGFELNEEAFGQVVRTRKIMQGYLKDIYDVLEADVTCRNDWVVKQFTSHKKALEDACLHIWKNEDNPGSASLPYCDERCLSTGKSDKVYKCVDCMMEHFMEEANKNEEK